MVYLPAGSHPLQY